MDIMMLLEGRALSAVYSTFVQKQQATGDGLSLVEFVATMLTYIPEDSKQNKLQLIVQLCELFDQIDVNGDGSMEWEEFTGFCVEAGLVAGRSTDVGSTFKYVYKRAFWDNFTHSAFIERITCCEETQRIFVCESDSSLVQVFKAGMTPLFSFDPAPCIDRLTTYVKRPHPLIVTSIPSKGMLAIAMSDLRIIMWHIENELQCGLLPIGSYPKALYWSKFSSKLYCGSADGIVRVYDLDKMLLVESLQHITRLQLLATASMDGTIALYSLETAPPHRLRGKLRGFSHGVREIVYSDQHQLLLGAGFEPDGLAWDVNTNGLLMKLSGHRTTLASIQVVPTNPQRAITVDTDGIFKLWGIYNAFMGFAPCLSTFTSGPLSWFIPRAVAVMSPDCSIIAGGMKLHMFIGVETRVAEAPIDILFSSVTQTFITACGRSLRIWDAKSGLLIRQFLGIFESDVTTMTFDHRQRKLVVGTAGGQVLVMNILNGAPMKETEPHTADVSCVTYAREDQCVISVSWDKSLRVYDESAGETMELLRQVDNAHTADIGAVVFDYELSIIATGSADSSVKCWDFQTCKLEAELHEHSSQVTALTFLKPYPILVSADASGIVCFWSVRGGLCPYSLLHKFTHVSESAQARRSPTFLTEARTQTSGTAVTCMQSYCPSDSEAWLITGDDLGDITWWDVTPMLTRHRVQPLDPAKAVPLRQADYDARRRAKRDEQVDSMSSQASGAASRLTSPVSRPRLGSISVKFSTSMIYVDDLSKYPTTDVQKHQCWPAHPRGVNGLRLTDKPSSILSDSIRIWSSEGALLGELDAIDNQRACSSVPWAFKADTDAFLAAREKRATDVMQAADELLRQGRVLEGRPRPVAAEEATRAAGAVDNAAGRHARDRSLLEAANSATSPRSPKQVPIMRTDALWNVTDAELLSDVKDAPDADDNPADTMQDAESKLIDMHQIALQSKAILGKYDQYSHVTRGRQKYREARAQPCDTTPSPFLKSRLGLLVRQTGSDRKRQEHGESDRIVVQRPPQLSFETAKPTISLTAARSLPVLPVAGTLATPITNTLRMRASSRLSMKSSRDPFSQPLPSLKQLQMARIESIISNQGPPSTISLEPLSHLRRQPGEGVLDALPPASPIRTKATGLATTVVETETGAIRIPTRLLQSASFRLREAQLDDFVPPPPEGIPKLVSFSEKALSPQAEISAPEQVVQVFAPPPGALRMGRRRSLDPTGDNAHFGIHAGSDLIALRRLFERFDRDSSGYISQDEFMASAEWATLFHLKEHAFSMFHTIDRNHDGKVSFAELLRVAFPPANEEQFREMLRYCIRQPRASVSAHATTLGLTNTQIATLEAEFDAIAGSLPALLLSKVMELLTKSRARLGIKLLKAIAENFKLMKVTHVSKELLLAVIEGILVREAEQERQ